MKAAILNFFLMLCLGNLYSQGGKTISGQVIDANSGQPFEFVSVSVSKPEGALISGTLTSSDGRFSLSGLAQGEYNISVSFVGYESYITRLLLGELNNNYDLGRINLAPRVTDVGSVTVTAQRSEISAEMDRKVYNLDNLITQSGGSVLDAMKSMPGVTVDQEGKVLLRGSDKVVVLIDGNQSGLTGFGNQKGLENIPSANIESIEIINNPSARYDAAGMAGIINIIYRKETQKGFSGSAGFAYGIGALTRSRSDLETALGSYSPTPKYIPSLDLNYNSGRFNFFVQSEFYRQKALPNNEFTTRYYNDGRIVASQVPENRTQNHYIFKGGIDYIINGSNTLSLSGIYDWERHQDTAQVPYINMLQESRNRYINWHEDEITGIMNYAVRYKHRFPQPGHEFSTGLQYTRNWEDETYYINDSSELRQGRDVTSVLGTEHILTFNLDYVKPMKSGRLESGTKLQVRNLPVDYLLDRGVNSIIYEGMGEWTKWGESIYAGYLNWIYEKTVYEIEGGIRAEYTGVFYKMDPSNIYYPQNDSYDYFDLFPNVRLTFKVNRNNRFSVFYNRRVDRPGEPELRIFAKSDDHELLKVGNPYLRPQFTQSAEAAWKTNWQTGSVFLSVYYRDIDDPYMRVYSVDTANYDYDVVVKNYANTGSASNTGFEIVYSQKITSFWQLGGNVNFYRNHIDSYTGNLDFPYEHVFIISESNDNTWDTKITNTFRLGKQTEIQLTGVYYAPKNIPQGRQFSRSSVDAGIKRIFFGGRGELNFSFSDIFNDYGIQQEIESEGLKALYENNYETQIIRIGLKYKF